MIAWIQIANNETFAFIAALHVLQLLINWEKIKIIETFRYWYYGLV